MDWVHCNNCFLLPERDKCFFLTSCGHIYCSDCEVQCARGLCKLCGNQCSSLVLSSSMKPDVQMYFTDPDVLLKKKLKEVHQISEFQKNHRARLAAYYRKQNVKFRQMRDDFKKILKSIRDLDSERARLLKENEALKKCLRMPSGTSHSMSSGNAAFTPTYGFENTPPPFSHMNPVFSSFFGKLDSSGASSSKSCMPERLSVFLPPVNGKIGSIPNTPSSAFRKMSLSSAHFSDNEERRNNDSQDSSPASSQESVLGLNRYPSCSAHRQANDPSSPLGSWTPQNHVTYKGHQTPRDIRKVVVHPYSPDD